MLVACQAVAADTQLQETVKQVNPDPGLTVVYVVKQVPESVADANGQVVYSIHLSGKHGAVFSHPAQTSPEAQEDTVILTLDYDTASKIHSGDLHPAAAMAMARVQVRGAAGKLVPLQDAFAKVPEALEALRSQTTY